MLLAARSALHPPYPTHWANGFPTSKLLRNGLKSDEKSAGSAGWGWWLFIAALSGTAALGHQIVWTRALVDVAGASSATFSKVVGIFFLGLSSGAWFASRWRPARVPWRRLALVEGSIALLSLPMLFIAPLGSWVAGPLGRIIVLQWLLPVATILLPSFMMGCALPALLQVSGGRGAVPIYALNTLGGVLGIGLATFAVFPNLGLRGSGLAFCALNAILAAAVWWRKPSAEPEPSGSASGSVPLSWRWMAAAWVSGFCMLGLEVLVQHQLAQVTINSMFSGAAVLGIILVTLGLGAIAVAGLPKRWAQAVAPWLCLGTALLCVAQPILFVLNRPGLAIFPYELPAAAYGWAVLKLSALALAPMFLAGGMVFPLALAHAEADTRQVGVLLAINGVGGWLGTIVFDHALGPVMGLWGPVIVAAALYGLVGVLLSESLKLRVVLLVLLVVTLAGLAPRLSGLPQVSTLPGEKLHALRVNPEGVVATVENAPGDWRILFNNSYTLGGSRAQFNQERQALLPLLLHSEPRTVGILGIATGSTTAGAALLPQVREIEAIELSPAVLDQARKFFASYNRQALEDPRVRVLVEDARWVMASRAAAYDVVIGDLFMPWRTGEGRLYSLEHFESVRRALRPGGLFCQWLPLFQLTEGQFTMILATFQRAFPEALLVRGDFYSDLPIIGLVGGLRLENVSWPRIEAACRTLREAGQVKDPLLRHPQGVAMLLLGPPPVGGTAAVNTLANASLELDAGRNILGLREPWLIGVPQAQFYQDVHRTGQPAVPEEFRGAHDAGQYVLTLEVAARSKAPFTDNLKEQFAERIPRELLTDQEAEWQQWPASVKPQRLPASVPP